MVDPHCAPTPAAGSDASTAHAAPTPPPVRPTTRDLQKEYRGRSLTGAAVAVLVPFVTGVSWAAALWQRHAAPPADLVVLVGGSFLIGVAHLVVRWTARLPASSPPPTHAAATAVGGLTIACSGGGIKSASFCLGALRRLDEAGLYGTATRLVAVSGGGYAASAFALAKQRGLPEPFAVKSDELDRLRHRTDYISDRPATRLQLFGSVLLGTTVTLVGTSAVIFLGVRAVAAYAGARGDGLHDRDIVTSQLLLPLVAAAVAVGLLVVERFRPEPGDAGASPDGRRRDLLEALPSLLVLLAGVWLVTVPGLIEVARSDLPLLSGVWGWLSHPPQLLSSVLGSSAVVSLLTQSASRGFRAPNQPGTWGTIRSRLRRGVAPTLGLLILFGGSVLWTSALLRRLLADPHTVWAGWPALLAAAALVLGVRSAGNANRTSLHLFYRDRLAYAYLGAVAPEAVHVRLADLSGCRPELTLCATANVVGTRQVDTGRGGTPFVLSAAACGFADARLPEAGRSVPATRFAVFPPVPASLASAMAVSGAAVSPVAGRDSALLAPYRLLLALANVRLGVWVASPYWAPGARPGGDDNPRRGGRAVTWLRRAMDSPSPDKVVVEALGTIGVGDPLIYLTDGGHYDNLGLVEALRHRPDRVVVLDGSGDPEDSFVTLGRAVATARMDLGIEIDIDPRPLVRGSAPHPPSAVVPGTALWRDGHRADIDYVKCVLPEGGSWDLQAYQREHPSFPASSDTLERYDEFDFEAYRRLGYWVAGAVPGVPEASRPSGRRSQVPPTAPRATMTR